MQVWHIGHYQLYNRAEQIIQIIQKLYKNMAGREYMRGASLAVERRQDWWLVPVSNTDKNSALCMRDILWFGVN